MNIFLTGGSGFVGQHVIRYLKQQGHDIQALVRSETAAIKVKKLGVAPILDALTSPGDHTERALANCEAVVHIAAHMDFTYDPTPFYQVNVEATKQLIDLSKKAGVKHFVYISAAPVVPGSPVINLTEDEATNALPKSLYPKTKAIAERAVLAANSTGFRTISLRPPAVWGPQNHHYEMLFDNVKNGKWRWIGGSQQVLSTIHVKNLAGAIESALQSNIGGEAFFVTDEDNRPMRITFQSILEAYDLEPGEKELPRGIAVFMAHLFGGLWKLLKLKSRPPVAPLMIRLMATEFSVSDEKAHRLLGYRPVISFEEGIRELKNSQS
ncbi:MAG: NAD-dependent epimerase/dehydratase family protein [Cytophagales bacterium]|nr:NAD-dependent epimerase/dehydratase family protein [Cytophagales bacterium]